MNMLSRNNELEELASALGCQSILVGSRKFLKYIFLPGDTSRSSLEHFAKAANDFTQSLSLLDCGYHSRDLWMSEANKSAIKESLLSFSSSTWDLAESFNKGIKRRQFKFLNLQDITPVEMIERLLQCTETISLYADVIKRESELNKWRSQRAVKNLTPLLESTLLLHKVAFSWRDLY